MAKEKKLRKQNKWLGNLIGYIVLTVLSIIWLTPFVCLVLQSFRSREIEGGGITSYVVPKTFSLDNYRWLLSSESDFMGWKYINHCSGGMFIEHICCICVSYSLSRMRLRT